MIYCKVNFFADFLDIREIYWLWPPLLAEEKHHQDYYYKNEVSEDQFSLIYYYWNQGFIVFNTNENYEIFSVNGPQMLGF